MALLFADTPAVSNYSPIEVYCRRGASASRVTASSTIGVDDRKRKFDDDDDDDAPYDAKRARFSVTSPTLAPEEVWWNLLPSISSSPGSLRFSFDETAPLTPSALFCLDGTLFAPTPLTPTSIFSLAPALTSTASAVSDSTLAATAEPGEAEFDEAEIDDANVAEQKTDSETSESQTTNDDDDDDDETTQSSTDKQFLELSSYRALVVMSTASALSQLRTAKKLAWLPTF